MQAAAVAVAPEVKTGRVLELGCGNCPNPGADVHHNIVAHAEYVDIAHDLDVRPWPWKDEEFSKIISTEVFEHLRSDIVDWLGECWRILEPRGLLLIQVPHAGSWTAWADPTHRRAFHDITFDYFDRSTVWHKQFGEHYFGDTNKWWTVVARDVQRTSSCYGELATLRFVLRKDSD